MFSAFKTSHSPEVNSLIKKHGITDALFIKNLGYFTNTHLSEVGSQGFTAMKTGVRKIVSGLEDSIGLTATEHLVLTFWSDHLGSAKLSFLAEHAHTIYEARGKTGPFSEPDLKFIRWTVDAMKHEVATTDTMLAEFCAEHGELLDLEYEMRTERGLECLLTGKVKLQREDMSVDKTMKALAIEPGALFITDQDAISRINGYRERLDGEDIRIDDDAKILCCKKQFAEERLNMLTKKREYLKSQK
ncbi:hypothetical protein FGADI_6127 [Fusarium gaditjirri]|uniref:Uncharacterized protein n=1 Tax=Fusarium gaditjirri TaxID=282569 RepID=A0A8H4T8L0_9HYPO|nr:hypothetical protein FGADI_6127 [Fusarium gaditjirri]